MKDHQHSHRSADQRLENSGNLAFSPPQFSLEASEEGSSETVAAPAQMKSNAFAAAPGDGGAAGSGGGSALPNDLRGQMEASMGADFSGVKVETNSNKASEMGALAYAQGESVHFAPGQFKPDTQAGKELIGHELAHVVQQREGRVQATGSENGMAVNTDKALEQEADQIGQAAAQMKTADSISAAPISDFGGPVQKATDPNAPQLTEYRGTDVNLRGVIVSDAANYGHAKSSGMKIRSKPLPGNTNVIGRLKYGEKVQVQATNKAGGWYFVMGDSGTIGWINQNFVALNAPDQDSRIHHVTESNLTEILQNKYVKTGLWKLSTGNDYTTLAAAVLSANTGRKGISMNWKAYEKYKETHKLKRYTDPWMIENFAVYASTRIVSGTNIWLPSVNYIKMLQQSGQIGSRPDWLNKAVDVGKTIVGFQAGVGAGIFGSLWDTLTGLFEVGKQIVGFVRDIFTGELFANIKSIYDEISSMSAEQLKTSAMSMVAAMASAIVEGASDFAAQWSHADTWKRWFFRGKVVGAVILEIVLAIFTAGAGNAAKWLGRIGKISPKLMAILRKAIKNADKLMPGGAKKLRNKKHADGLDTNADGKAGMIAKATMMARGIAEMHDEKDSSISELKVGLKGVQKMYSKVVRGHDVTPKPGMPGHYVVTQYAKKRVVDNDYTPGKEGGHKKRPADLPSWKKLTVDWDHIFERHHKDGPIARQRTRDGATVFGDLDHNQIKHVVKNAYKNINKKVDTQGDRIKVRGEYGGWKVEFWINKADKTLETAYPTK